MAEMKNCSIGELLGIKKHQDFISENEVTWWKSRSFFKPLPSVRQDIFHAEDLIFYSAKREVNEKTALRNWFKKDQTEEWAEEQKKVTARQKQLDLDNGTSRRDNTESKA